MPRAHLKEDENIFEPELTPVTLKLSGEEHRPEVPMPISNAAAGTTITTGHDLTKGGKLIITMKDVGGLNAGRPWPDNSLDIKAITDVGQFFIWNFDNDYVTVVIVDAENGILRFTDAGREAEYVASTSFELG